MTFINIGHENFVRKEMIAVIMSPDSAHAKKLRHDATERGILINATSGNKTRSILILTSCQVVLSSLQTATLKARTRDNHPKQPDTEEDKPF